MTNADRSHDELVDEVNRLRARVVELEASVAGDGETAASPWPPIERILSFITHAIPAYVAYVDSQERFRFANHRYCDYFVLSSNQIVGMPVREVIGSALYEISEFHIRQALHGKEQHFENHVSGPEGVETWFDVRYSPDVSSDGMVHGYYCLAVDVTEQRIAKQELLASEARFRALVENSYDVINLFSAEGELVYTSPSVKRVLGYDPGELIGTRGPILVHPVDLEDALQGFAEIADNPNASGHFVHRLRHKDGTYRTVEVTGTNLLHEPGVNAMVSIFRDVTQRKQQEERLREQEQALAHVSRLSTLGEMVAGIAHEINQPLSAISNFANACNNVVNTIDTPAAPMFEWTRQISEQAVRCGDIIRGLRDFAKKNDEARSNLNLNEVARESVALIGPDLRRSSISVSWKLDEPLPDVHANRIQIEQVVVNLLRNACEAIGHQNSEDRTIVLSSNASTECVRLTVEDHGTGIPNQNRDRMFDAFFTTKADGMGMGLAISRSIIEAHGGRLWVDKCRRDGATFHTELPIFQKVPDSVKRP